VAPDETGVPDRLDDRGFHAAHVRHHQVVGPSGLAEQRPDDARGVAGRDGDEGDRGVEAGAELVDDPELERRGPDRRRGR
jgi:hypothetical protein